MRSREDPASHPYRTTNVELELEAGEYIVLLRIRSRKFPMPPKLNMIRYNARERPSKLLRVGQSYEIAHAKGTINLSEEEKKTMERVKAKKEAKVRKDTKEQMMREKQKEKQDARKALRKKVAAATKEKMMRQKQMNLMNKSKKKKKVTAVEKAGNKQGADKEKSREAEKALKERPQGESREEPQKPTEPTSSATNMGATSNQEPSSEVIEFEERVAPPLKEQDSNTAEDDKSSDTTSTASDVTDGELDDRIQRNKSAAEASKKAAAEAEEKEMEKLEEEEEEVEEEETEDTHAFKRKHPFETKYGKTRWNATVIVGLRIYSAKGSGASVKVIRDLTEGDDEDKEPEAGLDVDDPAVDALQGVEETN